MVSFILVCRNQTPGDLCRCLESIMALSLRPNEREIIVVDDGSDECMICNMAEYRDVITYIRTKESGVGEARNTGLRMSTGMNVQFVDGGDRLMPEAYELCLDIVRYNAPDIVMFKSADKDIPVSAIQMPEPIDGARLMLTGNLDTPVAGYIFSRKLLMDLRFTPGLVYGDEEFTPLLVLRAEKIYATEISAYLHKKNANQETGNWNKRQILSNLNDMEYVVFRLNGLVTSIPRREQLALRRYVAQLTMRYIEEMMRLTHSSKLVDERIARLKSRGLFPLPERNYTARYSIFRMLTGNRFTRNLLARIWR